jgi:hypothetical protein
VEIPLVLALIIGIGAAIYWYIKKVPKKKKIEAEVYKTPIEKLRVC